MALSLRAKILLSMSAVVLLLVGLSLFYLNAVETREIHQAAVADLARARRVFEAIRLLRRRTLLGKSRLLSADHAFRSLVATYDPATLQSSAEGFRRAMESDLLIVTDEGGIVQAWTENPGRVGTDVSKAAWAAAALAGEETTAVLKEGDSFLQLTAVPIHPADVAPDVMGVLVLGFRINDALARELKELAAGEVSVTLGDEVVASSLAPMARRALAGRLAEIRAAQRPVTLDLGDGQYLGQASTLGLPGQPEGKGGPSELPVTVILIVKTSLEPALGRLRNLHRALLVAGGVSMLLAVVASTALSKRITRPLQSLVEGTRRVAAGLYDQPIVVRARDELGALAEAFNSMMGGLLDRERVRSVMHKVVSMEIAEEMLRGPVELGGEEREASVLFCDIRDFTSLSERLAAKELVRQLNEYLTAMSAAIDAHRGVVDKFIGDAVMAVFGVPVADLEHATHAVAAALEMLRKLDALNAGRRAAGLSPLAMGVGIATGKVVAGNMGSANRLNYTVMGDDVNLASRLESLTKTYGVPIIISEATHAGLDGTFATRLLGDVQLKGKARPVRIYAVEPEDAGASTSDP